MRNSRTNGCQAAYVSLPVNYEYVLWQSENNRIQRLFDNVDFDSPVKFLVFVDISCLVF